MPDSESSIMPDDSPLGTEITIGNPIPIDSNIFEGITVVNKGVSFRCTSDTSHRLHNSGIFSLGCRGIITIFFKPRSTTSFSILGLSAPPPANTTRISSSYSISAAASTILSKACASPWVPMYPATNLPSKPNWFANSGTLFSAG